MSQPRVVFQGPAGPPVAVAPGGFIGRMLTASLRVGDPRVSEAAALVSLRGRELHLLALRGQLQVDGVVEDDVILEAGQRVRLADAVDLDVVAVDLPERVLAVDLPGQTRELCAPVYSLVVEPSVDLVPAYVVGAPARIWSTAEGWSIDVGRGSEGLRPGRVWTVGDVTLRAHEVTLGDVGVAATLAGAEPLTLVVRTTTVHIQRSRRPPLPIDGLPGRVLSELALMAAPAPWMAVATEIWGAHDPGWLRTNWDRTMRRVRARLREGGVREDLVRPDGRGNVELYLHPGDHVVDEA